MSNWDAPNPSLASECAHIPPEPGGRGGAHSPAGEGLREPKFRRLEEKLSTLPTLWYTPSHFHVKIRQNCLYKTDTGIQFLYIYNS
jgi:hypothetical protein